MFAGHQHTTTEVHMQSIKSQFLLLLAQVQSAMESHRIGIADVQEFLGSMFDGDDCVLHAIPNLTSLFASVSELKLWHYDHYLPLKNLVERFLPMDESIRKSVADYQSALSEFYGTTKIVDFVKLSKQEKSAEATQRYMKHNSKLTMILRLEDPSSISEITLEYVNVLWKTFMKELSFSPHTAVIEDIIEEKLEITWLILPCTASRIKAAYSKALRFYQQHNIEYIIVNQSTLYNTEWIVSSGVYPYKCIIS